MLEIFLVFTKIWKMKLKFRNFSQNPVISYKLKNFKITYIVETFCEKTDKAFNFNQKVLKTFAVFL